jgi:hypothetical protein
MDDATMTVNADEIDVTQEVTPEETAQTDETEQTQEVEQQEPSTTDSEQTKPVVSDKASKDFVRLTKALADRQAEIANLKSQLAEGSKATAKTDESGEHPALKGLTPDDDGEYKINGRFYTKEEVIDRWETKNEVTELRSLIEAKEAAEADAKYQSQIDAAGRELYESTLNTVKSIRNNLFPDVSNDDASQIDEDVMDRIVKLTSNTKQGELTGEKLTEFVEKAFEIERKKAGIYGAIQIKDNAKYKANNPVTPGTPGTKPPIDPLNMSKKDAHKIADEAARLAEQATRGG